MLFSLMIKVIKKAKVPEQRSKMLRHPVNTVNSIKQEMTENLSQPDLKTVNVRLNKNNLSTVDAYFPQYLMLSLCR